MLPGMDHQRLATRFLISLWQRYGRDAPEVLRHMADELEALGDEVQAEELADGAVAAEGREGGLS
jgi:hypothetical protein